MTNEEVCCPPFDPALWNEIIFTWQEKKFIKDKVRTLFYIPLNYGGVMRRLDKKVREAGAQFVENMGLSDHTSKWNMDLYVAVDREIPGGENVVLSGKYFSKVYEGDFKETGNWSKNFEKIAKEKEITIEKYFMWYTTCPKCAKKYGKNYVVIIGKVS